MTTLYVQVRSWHVARERRFDPTTTRCGLIVRSHPFGGEHRLEGSSDVLPVNEKSCERCLQLATWHDRGEVEA